MKNKRVLVAMSGGVDSSVAASLLVEKGYEVIGATMQVWDYSKNSCDMTGTKTCCSSLDVEDARKVADKLKIPFYVLNCESKFQTYVIDEFVGSYLEGKTPIPCINCNTYLKFDHLIKKMKELDCAYLATGHYAKILNRGKKARIVSSEDSWKDQTYFLFTLNPQFVPYLMFPVGDWEKKKVRDYAEEKGLVVARKKDSTGICFAAKGPSSFINSYVAKDLLPRGLLKRYPTGEVLGEHEGVHNFTLGQRKGIKKSYSLKPYYVIKIDGKNKEVWLGEEKYLYSKTMKVKRCNLFDEFKQGESFQVKIRFRHQGSLAKAYKRGDEIHFVFETPQKAITPGQAAVMYKGKELVGGGWIYGN